MQDGRVRRGKGVTQSLVNHVRSSGFYLEGLEEFQAVFAL